MDKFNIFLYLFLKNYYTLSKFPCQQKFPESKFRQNLYSPMFLRREFLVSEFFIRQNF